MRGDGDEAMEENVNITLLKRSLRISEDYRKVTGKRQSRPQVWALYKEVQDYYDHGMRCQTT